MSAPRTPQDETLDQLLRRKPERHWLAGCIRWLKTLTVMELRCLISLETAPAETISLLEALGRIPPAHFPAELLEERLWAQGLLLRAWPVMQRTFGAANALGWLRLTASARLTHLEID